MVQAVRCAVIGAGQWATLAHAPGLQSHPAAHVGVICGRRSERLRVVADRFGIAEISTEADDILDRPDIDAVTIATPNSLHAAQVLHALDRGKHVFCEKPLGLDAVESRTMLDA